MEQTILIRGARQLLTLRGPAEIRRGALLQDLGIIVDGAALIQGGKILAVGPSRRIENLREAKSAFEIRANGRLIMPGMVDSSLRLMLGGLQAALKKASVSTILAEATTILRSTLQHGTIRAEIKAGGATPEGPAQSGEVAMLGYLLRNRKVWGLTIGFAAYGYSFYLFLTWLPNYLVESMHMSILKSAGYTAIPWACATVADLVVGGWLIDHLIARGYNETPVRKTVLVGGMLLGLAVFGATLTTSPLWAVVWISIALSGLAAAAPVGWSIPSLIAPRGGTGTIGGIMNFLNNLMGVVAPVAT